MALLSFLAAYLLGGLTFLPLVLVAVFLHAYFTLPKHEPQDDGVDASLSPAGDGTHAALEYPDDLPPELKKSVHEPDTAAGYFAVTREFVPGGVNGKPPERITPAGTVVESPSVYQNMYRSIFEWGKASTPSMDTKPSTVTGRVSRRARNVFFVVLRYAHIPGREDGTDRAQAWTFNALRRFGAG